MEGCVGPTNGKSKEKENLRNCRYGCNEGKVRSDMQKKIRSQIEKRVSGYV
jgi:hypothetical protein